MTGDGRYLTQRDAAMLCGVSYDTIRRRRVGHMFLSARKRPGDAAGTWEIALADLINAGLYDPAGAESPDDNIRGGRAERELARVRTELVEARAKLAAVEELRRSLEEEVRFLRRALVDAIGSRRGN